MDTQQDTITNLIHGLLGGGRINVGQKERTVSTIGGALLVIDGLRRGGLSGIAEAIMGGALVQRGTTGHCSMYNALHIDTADRKRHGSLNQIKVQQSITVSRDAQSVYDFWRHLDNLPKFMDHLESVTVVDEKRSKWVAKAPAGQSVEWEAEITEDSPGHHIAWRSLPGATVSNNGAVGFVAVEGGRATDVRVSLQYSPPAGAIGALIAKLFGEEPNQQIADDLRRFKEVIESGQMGAPGGERRSEGQSGSVVAH